MLHSDLLFFSNIHKKKPTRPLDLSSQTFTGLKLKLLALGLLSSVQLTPACTTHAVEWFKMFGQFTCKYSGTLEWVM